jgi:hypothetical protein
VTHSHFCPPLHFPFSSGGARCGGDLRLPVSAGHCEPPVPHGPVSTKDTVCPHPAPEDTSVQLRATLVDPCLHTDRDACTEAQRAQVECVTRVCAQREHGCMCPCPQIFRHVPSHTWPHCYPGLRLTGHRAALAVSAPRPGGRWVNLGC